MITIEECREEDREAIARAVMMALHEEYEPDEPWSRIFTALAGRPDSQYSYRNALKAVTSSGEVAGVIVAYNGGLLDELRKAFINEYRNVMGHEITNLTDETVAGEWYLDSLAVFPGFRRMGAARALIEAAIRRAPAELTPGLLCAQESEDARRLYEAMGFEKAGERPFLGQMMDHLVYQPVAPQQRIDRCGPAAEGSV